MENNRFKMYHQQHNKLHIRNKLVKYVLSGLLSIVAFCSKSFCQSATPLQSFPLSSVRLLESPFKQAQQKDYEYLMALDPNRLLFPYLCEAGLPTTNPNVSQMGSYRAG